MRKKTIAKKVAAKWQYLGGDDPAQWVWSNRTHRSASEAFKDAEYACAITKFKNDWQLSLEYLSGAIYGFFTIGMMLLIPVLLVMWLTK